MTGSAIDTANVTADICEQAPKPRSVEMTITQDLTALGADPAAHQIHAPRAAIALCVKLAVVKELDRQEVA